MDNLVRGFMKVDFDEDEHGKLIAMETLYAIFPDGSLKCCSRPYSNTFFRKEDVWKNCKEVDVDATYCGNYEMI